MTAPSAGFIRIKEVWTHAGFQKYFRNTGWMFVGQMSMIVSLVTNIWIARHLGPTHFGSLSYIFAFAGVFLFIANLGLQDILIRDLVRFPEERQKLISTCIRLLGFGGAAAFIITSTATLLLNGLSLVSLLIIMYATASFWSPINAIAYYFQATVEAKRNSLIQITNILILTSLKIYLIMTGAGIIWLTLAFTLDFYISGLLYIFVYKKSGLRFITWTFDWKLAVRMLRASFPLMLAAGFAYLLLKSDQLLIKFFLGETPLGFYAAAVRLTDLWYFIPGIIGISLFPAIVNAKAAGETTYRRRLNLLFAFLLGLAVCIALPITVFAAWLVPLVFGVAYAPAIPIVQLYIWSSLGYFLTIAATKYLITEDRIRDICLYTALGAGGSILLNSVLIPIYGLTGAAIAAVISSALFPLLFFIRRYAYIH